MLFPWGVLALIVSTGALVDGGEKGDADKIQGVWTARESRDGKEDMKLEFKGKTFTLSKGTQGSIEGTFTVDATQKPKAITMTMTGGTAKESQRHAGKACNGIYELDGETLKWCANEPGKEERPKEFSDKHLLLTFKRAK